MNHPQGLTRRRLPPEVRYAQLLRCAVTVFARRGLGEARHAEIAEEAGVAVSTVFVYFPTREVLVDKVLGEVSRAIMDMAVVNHRKKDPEDSIVRQHIDAFIRFAEEEQDLAKVWMDWSTAIRDDIWPAYVQLQEDVVNIISLTIDKGKQKGTIRNNMQAGELARLMVGSAHMLASMQFLSRDKAEIASFATTLHKLLTDHSEG